MDPRRFRFARRVVTIAVSAFLLAPHGALAQSYQILHTFTINSGNGDGGQPFAALIQGTDGNFYGTTGNGGTSNWGSVFKMDASGHVTILHSFDGADGMLPKASLVQGSDGWLYGTTSNGGTPGGAAGAGTVFSIKTDGTSFTTLHTFGLTDGNGGIDGAGPVAGLVQGNDGDLYGTTAAGGALGGAGTVFKITSTGTFTRLHTFTNPDGRIPVAPLIQASDGNFYGTTTEGGTAGFNVAVHGTIFKITSTGTFTLLHTFTFPNDLNSGADPEGPLLQASDGNFYGMTAAGGIGHFGNGGDGTIYRMDPAGNVTTLHSFNRTDGYVPHGGLIQGTDGLFYGTTTAGGSGPTNPVGTVFRMNAAGAVETLHVFTNGLNSEYSPPAGVIRGTDGSLYGVTQLGGPRAIVGLEWGVVFRMTLIADLTVNFGAPYGVWVRAGNSWTLLHGLSPVSMVTGDLDGNGLDDAVINFGPGVGVYAWMNHATWTFLHSSSPTVMVIGDLDNNGHDDLVAVFPGFGIWRWSDGTWTNLHALDAMRLAVGQIDGVANADVIVDFPGYGVWVLANGSTWTPLHPLHPTTMVTADLDGNGRDDVVFDFPGYGLWVYYDSGTLGLLHSLSASHLAAGHLDANAKAELVIDFGAGVGIWVYRNNATWSFLHGSPSENLLLADLDGTGKDEVIVDFGPTYGLWQYANDSVWSQLHAISPAGLATGRYY